MLTRQETSPVLGVAPLSYKVEDPDVYSQVIRAVRLRQQYAGKWTSQVPNSLPAIVKSVLEDPVTSMQRTTSAVSTDETHTVGAAESSYSADRTPPVHKKEKNRDHHSRSFDRSPMSGYASGFARGVLTVRLVDSAADTADSLLNDSDPCYDVTQFYRSMNQIAILRGFGPAVSWCYTRLELLQSKFELYTLIHADQERSELCANKHRDFYNVRKVDNHVHHSAAMNGKHLLRFIRNKLERCGEDIVGVDKVTGGKVTLRETFERMNLSSGELSLDKLNVLADKTTLHRFDRFNAKYNPFGQPELRSLFLKTDNTMKGRYLAELTKELIRDMAEWKYQLSEWRLSIYGKKKDEWQKLSAWVLENGLVCNHNEWMIQVPRLYSVYRKNGELQSFQDMLSNIFTPLVDAVLFPEQHPQISAFLEVISGIDIVDDESKSGVTPDLLSSMGTGQASPNGDGSSGLATPDRWTIEDNPSYSYYCFYIYANVRKLNELLALRGRRTLLFRPHCGECGDVGHLETAFLLADGINHGLNLKKCPVLQYLYYISQIPIAMSPCSNNQLFMPYDKNPVYSYFCRGLVVSLTTDDPLMFHQTREPLIEEYSIAKQIYRLNQADLCELAKYSVLQSGFPNEEKAKWLGSLDPFRNDILRTNVPNLRVRFRRKTFFDEWNVLNRQCDELDSLINFSLLRLNRSPGSISPASQQVAATTLGGVPSTVVGLSAFDQDGLVSGARTDETSQSNEKPLIAGSGLIVGSGLIAGSGLRGLLGTSPKISCTAALNQSRASMRPPSVCDEDDLDEHDLCCGGRDSLMVEGTPNLTASLPFRGAGIPNLAPAGPGEIEGSELNLENQKRISRQTSQLELVAEITGASKPNKPELVASALGTLPGVRTSADTSRLGRRGSKHRINPGHHYGVTSGSTSSSPSSFFSTESALKGLIGGLILGTVLGCLVSRISQRH